MNNQGNFNAICYGRNTIFLSLATHSRNRGNTHALGKAGELVLERVLERSGFKIFKGPANNDGKHYGDIYAYDAVNKKILVFDNKVLQKKSTVDAASGILRRDLEDDLLRKLETSSLDQATKAEVKAAYNCGKIERFVANASPVKIRNMVRSISSRLSNSGVRMASVSRGGVEIAGEEAVVAGKTLKRLAKGTVIAGVVLSVGMSAERASAANQDDIAYQQMMNQLGMKNPPSAHDSLQREVSVIAGEESVGYGAAGVVGVVGTFVGCGPWGTAAGVAAGGIAGDWAGGGLAGWVYDLKNGVPDDVLDGLLEGDRD